MYNKTHKGMKMHTTTILHISDIHIEHNPEKHFDRSVVLDPFLDRIADDYQNGIQPEVVVVTGDIAYKGIRDEYELHNYFSKILLT